MNPYAVADLFVRAEKALARFREEIRRYHELRRDLTSMNFERTYFAPRSEPEGPKWVPTLILGRNSAYDFGMEADIRVNEFLSIWVESNDNLSFTIAAKVPPGKPIIVTPIESLELRLIAEDLSDGAAVHLLHLKFTADEARSLGERLLAIALGRW